MYEKNALKYIIKQRFITQLDIYYIVYYIGVESTPI